MCRESRVSSRRVRPINSSRVVGGQRHNHRGNEKEPTGFGKSRSMERQAYCRGSIANFFIRESSVVRLMPMRAAAPSAPPTRPLDSASA